MDVDRVIANVDRAAGQMRFAAAFALTAAMKDVREAEVKKMQSVFDRPTPYTLNALRVTPANKRTLRAELGFKEFGGTPAWKYLGPQVKGGSRRPKGFERALQRAGILKAGEYAIPTGIMARNAYGSVPGGQFTRILSALGANPDPLSNTRRRPKAASRKRNLDYFVLRGKKAPDGIYLRTGRVARAVILFVSSVSYRARYPYYETAASVLRPAFRRHFANAYERFVVNDSGRKRAA